MRCFRKVVLFAVFTCTCIFRLQAAEPELLMHCTFDDTVIPVKAAAGTIAELKDPQKSTFVEGRIGKAIRLEPGGSIRFMGEKNVDLTQGSASFWIRAVDWDPSMPTKTHIWAFVVQTDNQDDILQFFKLPSTTLMASYGTKSSAAQITYGGISRWKMNEWHFITLTWSPDSFRVYTDGKLSTLAKLTEKNRLSGKVVRIKLQAGMETTDYDDLKIYKNTLTADEVVRSYPQAEAATSLPRGNVDEGKFAASEGGILLDAPFDSFIQANKANGSQLCTTATKINFTGDGVLNQAVRLCEGDSLRYEQKHNINLDKGTVTFWMRAVDWDPGRQTKNYNWIFSIGQGAAEGGRIQIFKMPSQMLMGFVGSQGKVKQITHSTAKWEKNKWYFLALSWGGGNAALYVNGKLSAKVDLPESDLPRDTGDLIRLQSSCGTTDYDALTIYDHVLTDGQIENIYLANLPGDAVGSHDYRPVVMVGRSGKAPVIDGVISPTEWDNSVKIKGFLEIPELEVTTRDTSIRAAYDDQALYFLVKSVLDKGVYPKPETVDLKTLWLAPSAEILLQTGTEPGLPVYQLAFNMYGQALAFKNSKPTEMKAEVATRILDGEWVAEIRLPYAELGVNPPETNAIWRFNCGRNFRDPYKFSNPTLAMAYGDVSNFWDFIFAEKPGPTFDAVVDQQKKTVQVKPLSDPDGNYQVKVWMKKLPYELPKFNTLLKKPAAIQGMVVTDAVCDGKPIVIPGAGRYLVVLDAVDNSGKIGFRQLFHFKLRDSFNIRFNFLSRQKIMNIVWELNQPAQNDFILKAQILDENDKLVTEKEIKVPARENSGSIPFDMSKFDQLNYQARVTLAIDGKTEERIQPFKCFYNAEWIGFEERMKLNQKLVAPWIPIRISDNIITTLTQRYRLAPTGLPEQVSVIDKELLQAPAVIDFGTVKSKFEVASPIRWLKKSDAAASWSVDYKADDATASLIGTVEFDGMIRYDLTVRPLKPGVSLKNMILNIPFKAEKGKFMFPYAGPYQKWGQLDIPTEINKRYADAFMPHLWVGDDTTGIAWFAETDEFYRPRSREKVVEVNNLGDRVYMQINMVEEPLPLSGAITYTFGIQATPSKTLAPDWTSTHLASCVSTTRTPAMGMGYTTGPEYHKYAGVPYPTKDDRRAERVVREYQAVPNRHALIYATSNGMGGSSPEFIFFEEEWKNPLSCDTWTLAARGEYHWGTDPNSRSLRDFYLWSCHQAIEKFNVDGFYYDFATVMGVDNPAGGSGYVRDGKRYRTWPIFGDRAMRRGIYAMVMDKRGHATFVYHNYSQVVAPIVSFATMILDGEPYQQRTGVIGTKITSDYTKIIPLSRFRTMFGVQFGTVPYLLVKFPNYSDAEEYRQATRTVIALAMPHGVPVWGFYCSIPELNRFIAFQDSFGLSGTTFIPYHANKGEITTVPEQKDQILLSYWQKADGKLLVGVSNLTGKPYSGKISFNGELASNKTVRAMAQPEIRVNKGEALNVSIPAKDYQLYLVSPAE